VFQKSVSKSLQRKNVQSPVSCPDVPAPFEPVSSRYLKTLSSHRVEQGFSPALPAYNPRLQPPRYFHRILHPRIRTDDIPRSTA
jgi:hypothetical protein